MPFLDSTTLLGPFDLAGAWDFMRRMAAGWSGQKRAYSGTRIFTPDEETHFRGLLGEYTYAWAADRPLDLRLHPNGTKCVNTTDEYGRTVDVVTATRWRDPYLKQFPNAKHWADLYVLVALDVEGQRSWLAGQVTRETLQAAPLIDWKHGAMLSLRWNALDPLFTPPEGIAR